jgi:uncharacterized membrane protein YoaK (UPF0700 family)
MSARDPEVTVDARNRSGRSDPEPLSQAAARSIHHPLTRALLVLTLTTGLVDAASYLGLGGVFTANMTGNIVLLGFGIAGGAGLPVVGPLVSLGAFLVGAGTGGILCRRTAARAPNDLARALAIEVSLLGVAAIGALALEVRTNAASADLLIALLALAMGVRNATVRRIGVPDLTTTVLTLTLTGLAAESPLAGGSGRGSSRRIAAVAAMLAGALAGALLLKTSLALLLAVATALALATWVAYVPGAVRSTSSGRPSASQ